MAYVRGGDLCHALTLNFWLKEKLPAHEALVIGIGRKKIDGKGEPGTGPHPLVALPNVVEQLRKSTGSPSPSFVAPTRNTCMGEV